MKNHLRSKRLLLAPTMFALFAFVLAACGGGSASGTGSDEDYVKAVCKAGAKFEERLEDVETEADEIMTDAENVTKALEEMLSLFAEPFADFANDLAKANPPADVKATHDQLVDALKAMGKQLADGDLAALEETGEALDQFEPSQAIKDRLELVAAGVSECEGNDFFN